MMRRDPADSAIIHPWLSTGPQARRRGVKPSHPSPRSGSNRRNRRNVPARIVSTLTRRRRVIGSSDHPAERVRTAAAQNGGATEPSLVLLVLLPLPLLTVS